MHECYLCGQACACDLDDHWNEDFEDCRHVCTDQDEWKDVGPPAMTADEVRQAYEVVDQPDQLKR